MFGVEDDGEGMPGAPLNCEYATWAHVGAEPLVLAVSYWPLVQLPALGQLAEVGIVGGDPICEYCTCAQVGVDPLTSASTYCPLVQLPALGQLADVGIAPPSTAAVPDVLLAAIAWPTVNDPEAVMLPPPAGVPHVGAEPFVLADSNSPAGQVPAFGQLADVGIVGGADLRVLHLRASRS